MNDEHQLAPNDDGAEKLRTTAVWSVVLGLLSIFGLFVFIQIPAAIGGIILGRRVVSTQYRKAGIAGIAFSLVGLLIYIVLVLLVARAVAYLGWEGFVRALQESF